MNNFIFNPLPIDKIFFVGFSAITLLCLFFFLILKSYIILLIPFGILICAIAVLDIQKLFYLFFFLLPFSIEFSLSDQLGTDLPAEPLMVLISTLTLIWLIIHYHKSLAIILYKPLLILVIIHVFWIFYTTLLSDYFFVSIKYLIAKIWYILPFYVLPVFILKTQKDWKPLLRMLIFSSFIALLFVMVNHIPMGLSFKSINNAVSPIFRNHVSYACLLVLCLPFIFLWIKWHRGSGATLFLKYTILLLFLIAIYFSYTRVAMVSTVIAIVALLLMRLKLIKITLLSIFVVAAITISSLIVKNQYLDYAPDYQKTITHYHFDKLIEATYKMEDISVAERIYRWVAGYHMIKENPLWGLGPGTFYFFYKSYTVNRFKTYVSDNPEKSGIHNYYLMLAAEQGIIGALIFIALIVVAMIYGEKKYHLLPDGFQRDTITAGFLLLVMIASILLINDMVEAAKVGPFFFLSLALITR